MIVGMRTRSQAEKVAALTGGVQLPGNPKHDGGQALSRYVDVGADFGSCRGRPRGGVCVGVVRAVRR
jgi:putative transposase